MMSKKNIALFPNQITVTKPNGSVCLHINFNDGRDDISIELNSTEAEHLSCALGSRQREILIAAEYAD
ncbi:hypothetical protein [Kosakonia sacchari]|uniref:Uncharacterized protein n=1 Tax=Kosakonia sacchari TaxID=1158459 RepID=A0A1G4XBI4_9ENTR|nr:hypothetical protein [Kosakonia sacchari]MDN2484976.1 hypothetical protein [Kosakonia sacchari]SCX38058.1 hypothetical protein SAMN02927897_00182 [Kosakonia sacchari]